MNATFRVQWQRLFKSLSISISVAIVAPVLLMMGFRFLFLGFDLGKTFEHISPPVFLIVLLCVPLFSSALAFLVSQWFRLASITVSNGTIRGRNYWGVKNQIPMTDITKLTRFSDNGINAIIVHSRYHGKIYISDRTERLKELLELLETYILHNAKPA